MRWCCRITKVCENCATVSYLWIKLLVHLKLATCVGTPFTSAIGVFKPHEVINGCVRQLLHLVESKCFVNC